MKRLWARVGMEFKISDEEYDEFVKVARENRERAELIFEKWIKENKGELSGESYFPEQGCFGDDTTDNVEEIDFLF